MKAGLIVLLLALTACGSANRNVATADAKQAHFATLDSGQVWTGWWEAGGERMGFTLRIGDIKGQQIPAVLEFFHVATHTAGSFQLSGQQHPETHEITLEPGDWVIEPQNYDTLGLVGQLSEDGHTWTGRTTGGVKGTFELHLKLL